MHSAFKKPRENRGKVFGTEINLFFWQGDRAAFQSLAQWWLCCFSCKWFFFFLIPSAWLSSLLQFLLWKRCLFICGNYLLTQEADSKQPVVFLNQNLHLQLVLSWVIEVCFTQFRSWCLQLLACLFESDRNLLTHISCLMLIKGVRSAFSQWCLLH